MEFNTYSSDLQILCKHEYEVKDLKAFCEERQLKLESHFSNVEGQEWYGKVFYEIPFCASMQREIQRFIQLKRVSEMMDALNKLILDRSKHLISSGAIDLDKYDGNNYELPRILLTASLDYAIDQYKPLLKEQQKTVNNLIKF